MPDKLDKEDREARMMETCTNCKTTPRLTLRHDKSGYPMPSSSIRFNFMPSKDQMEKMDALLYELEEPDSYAMQLQIRHYMLKILDVYDHPSRRGWVSLETMYRPELDTAVNNGLYHELVKAVNLDLPSKLGMPITDVLSLPMGTYMALRDTIIKSGSAF